jgi:hypothetical protein
METQMPQPTGKIKADRPDLATNYTRNENADLTDLSHIDPNLIRDPDYWVYVFTVADRDFNVERPSINVKIKVPKSEESLRDKEAYRLVWKVPSPYPLIYADQTTGELKTASAVAAEHIAMDICNPNQKSTDLDAYIPPEGEGNIGLGDDLISKGLFFVHQKRCKFAKDDTEKKKPIPPATEVEKAVARKEKYYNGLLDKCKSLEYSSQSELADFVKAEPDVHLACEYFGVETTFHQARSQKQVPVECPICGTEMKRGAAFHPLPGSKLGICVNNWDKAIEAGVISEEDRPKKAAKKVQEPVEA